jgi:hypothetical protein
MCLDCLDNVSVFSVIDLHSGYWHLQTAPEYRHKIAFITKYASKPCGVLLKGWRIGLTPSVSIVRVIIEQVP